jgi:galactoside O-acetyltransferase
MGFLSASQLLEIGFLSCGKNVLISDKASFYGASGIVIGDSVRIDDFCILSAGTGGIKVGNFVHIACYSSIIGRERISLGDFANVSSRVSIYSSSDDYSGMYLTNPMIPEEFKNVDHRTVSIGRHVILGCGAVVLPGVSIGEGCAIGALSLVKANCDAFGTYAGIPAIRKGTRSRDLLMAEERFLEVTKRD